MAPLQDTRGCGQGCRLQPVGASTPGLPGLLWGRVKEPRRPGVAFVFVQMWLFTLKKHILTVGSGTEGRAGVEAAVPRG